MKKQVQQGFVLVIGIAIVMLIAGCEEQSLTSTKECRLLAAENIQLKNQLNEYDKKIENHKEELEKLQQQKQALVEATDYINTEFVEALTNENKEVRKENEQLKAEVEKLKKELEEPGKIPKLPQAPEPL